MKTISKVLTANRLSDGIAVWYARSQQFPHQWVERVEEASAVNGDEAITALQEVAADTLAKGQHCDVALVDVEDTANGLRPLKLRERIRAMGPTIQIDYGSQTNRFSAGRYTKAA